MQLKNSSKKFSLAITGIAGKSIFNKYSRFLILLSLLVSASGFSQTSFTNGEFRYYITSEENRTVSIDQFFGLEPQTTIPSSVNYAGTTYTVTAIGYNAFSFNNLTSITIPETVTRIEDFAFEMSNLTSITLPAGITYIGMGAFDGNRELSSVISLSTTPYPIEPDTFGFDSSFMIDLTIPTGSAAAYAAAGWTEFRSITEVDMGSTEITGVTFENKSFTYNGDSHSLAVNGLPEGASVSYNNNDKTNAGIYEVVATVSQENYKNLELTANLTINKAEAVITADAVQTFTYDGDMKNVDANLNHSETSLTYTPAQGYVNAGNYKITVSAEGTDNYLPTSKEVSLVIEKAEITGVTFTGDTFTYDGTEHSIFVNDLPEGATVEYANNGQINAGKYTVTAISKPGKLQ